MARYLIWLPVIVASVLICTAFAKPIMIEVKDCIAAEMKTDKALFSYLMENGFAAATNKAPLVDFDDPHTRVTRYPDCLVHIRTVLARPSQVLVDRQGNHYASSQSNEEKINDDSVMEPQEQVKRREAIDTLREIEVAYSKCYTANVKRRSTALFEKDDIEGDGVRDLRSAALDSEKDKEEEETEKVITLSFDSRVRMFGDVRNELLFYVDPLHHHSGTKQGHASSSSTSELKELDDGAKARQMNLGSLPWYLDRITGGWAADNAYTVNGSYAIQNNSTLPHWVFVVGTGIMREHQEFIDPVTNRSIVRDVVFDAYPGHTNDRNSHETLVASLITGRYYTRGPANVVLFDVVVLDKNGEGWLSDITSGVTSIYYYLREHNKNGTHVSINMSLGGSGSQTFADTLHGVFQSLRLEFDAVIFASAGNDRVDACNVVPASLSARLPNVITVASSNKDNRFSTFSNYGACVTAIAPGEDILGASNRCPSCYAPGSGTSFSGPLLHRLFIIARSANLTDIWLQRNIPPQAGEFCVESDEPLHANINTPGPHWLQDNVCMNGVPTTGLCPVESIVSQSQVCVDGVIDNILCTGGTWVIKYVCDAGAFQPTAAPSTDTADDPNYSGDVIHDTYLQSDLVVDFLLRFNSYLNAISATPAQTANRAVVLNPTVFIGADTLPYSYVRSFSMVGADKPGLSATARLVPAVMPKTIPVDPRYTNGVNNVQHDSTSDASSTAGISIWLIFLSMAFILL